VLCYNTHHVPTNTSDAKLPTCVLLFVDEFVYLGHVITNDVCDDRDSMRKYRSTCVRANVLKRTFVICSNDVKFILFLSYCTNLYCSSLWTNFTAQSLRKLNVCYNNALRCILNLPRSCSASTMFVCNNVNTCSALMRSSVYLLMSSQNTVIMTLCTSAWHFRSPIFCTTPRWRNACQVYMEACCTRVDISS
jgi:hypothetical protein